MGTNDSPLLQLELARSESETRVRGVQESPKRMDCLLVECSGLSEVLPVAQTFFSDAFVQADAVPVEGHLPWRG